jgi:hypothetical protein
VPSRLGTQAFQKLKEFRPEVMSVFLIGKMSVISSGRYSTLDFTNLITVGDSYGS